MTERLYYHDPHTLTFSARIRERTTHDGQPAVVLDQTYFYPEGGGQPADTGTLGGVAVIDVQPSGDGADVLHVLGGEPPAGDVVECEIDAARRLDHMQHHTGQHILTQAFVEIAGASTVGFHLGAESVTIDLDRPDIAPDVVAAVEDLANGIVFEDRAVRVEIVAVDETDGVRIRAVPEHLHTGGLRVITVEGFDSTACGGTHVSRTGEIGLIKVVKVENHRAGSRVEFRCGGRALRDYREKHAILTTLAADLTVGYWEVGEAVGRLRDALQEASRSLRAAHRDLLEFEAARLLATPPAAGEVRLVQAAYDDRDAGWVRALASRLAEEPGTVALLGAAGEKAQVILARSPELPHNLNGPLQAALATLGGARGGGRPEFCQGGGTPATRAQLIDALGAAAAHLARSAEGKTAP